MVHFKADILSKAQQTRVQYVMVACFRIGADFFHMCAPLINLAQDNFLTFALTHQVSTQPHLLQTQHCTSTEEPLQLTWTHEIRYHQHCERAKFDVSVPLWPLCSWKFENLWTSF